MNSSKFLIVGGGMVAGYAAKEMVARGLQPGDLTILSADSAIPYERPPLSKGFLLGRDTEDAIRINPAEFYRAHGIDLQLSCEVTGLDPKTKQVHVKSGESWEFSKLLIATGARPRTLDLPGAGLQNLYYLRSLDNSKSIRQGAQGAKRAVVIGGGFIGMEVAAVLAQKDLEVTMVLNEDRIWKRLFTPEVSGFFEGYYSARGVRIVKNAAVTALQGDAAVRFAILADGKTVACDLVVAGIGVKPAVEMLAGSGLELADGVVVNEYLETSHAGIYAAGDVANYYDVLFGNRRRVEHWDNAVSQGEYCARALMGDDTPFRHVPYFFSDIFDLSYEYWGDTSGADQVITRGDLASKSFSVWWLQEKRLIAAFTMNRPEEERDAAPRWIESKQPVSESALRDSAQSVLAAAA